MVVLSFLFGFFFAILLCVGSYKVARTVADSEEENEDEDK